MTKIEWTRGDDGTPGKTWNAVTGCTKVSQGCKNCYAERLAPKVFAGQVVKVNTTPPKHPEMKASAFRPRHFTDVLTHPDRLDAPLHWKKPRRVFVNSMSDLFHEDIPDEFIDQVFAVMALAPQHTFQVLTKRAERMLAYMTRPNGDGLPAVRIGLTALGMCCDDRARNERSTLGKGVKLQGSDINPGAPQHWPLPNVWLGVSVEDQENAHDRINALLAAPAAVRFLSCEPLLGPLNISCWLKPINVIRPDPHGRDQKIDWVIAGGESGPKARPAHPDWFRSLRDQCAAAGVPFFFKQWGEWAPDECQGPNVWQHLERRVARWMHDHFEIEKPGKWPDHPDLLFRLGKKNAGRLLDGREHSEYPA